MTQHFRHFYSILPLFWFIFCSSILNIMPGCQPFCQSCQTIFATNRLMPKQNGQLLNVALETTVSRLFEKLIRKVHQKQCSIDLAKGFCTMLRKTEKDMYIHELLFCWNTKLLMYIPWNSQRKSIELLQWSLTLIGFCDVFLNYIEIALVFRKPRQFPCELWLDVAKINGSRSNFPPTLVLFGGFRLKSGPSASSGCWWWAT